MKPFLAVLLVIVALTACLPQANTINQVAVLNAPADARITVAAVELEDQLRARFSPLYSLVPSSTMRFAETRNDFYGSRYKDSASLVARTFGAEMVVLVSAPVYDRTIEISRSGDRRSVSLKMQLEISIFDPLTQDILASYRSDVYSAFRTESTVSELVSKEDDPDAGRIVKDAMRLLSQQVATDLDYLFQRLSPPQGSEN